MLIIKDPTVPLKCMTAIKVLFLYLQPLKMTLYTVICIFKHKHDYRIFLSLQEVRCGGQAKEK
jgi:hypothetical protein